MNTHVINIRINKDTKRKAQKIVEKMGLDLSSAVKLFINKVIMTESIPFEIRTENGYSAIKEAELLQKAKYTAKHGKRYRDVEEAIRELDK